MNLCGPHMLSVAGRCFTFDMSADGFERGEGSSCFLARSEESVPRDALATVIGACLNQDGRSHEISRLMYNKEAREITGNKCLILFKFLQATTTMEN